jgi:hypothetical protein
MLFGYLWPPLPLLSTLSNDLVVNVLPFPFSILPFKVINSSPFFFRFVINFSVDDVEMFKDHLGEGFDHENWWTEKAILNELLWGEQFLGWGSIVL